jgi:hypothetical protein
MNEAQDLKPYKFGFKPDAMRIRNLVRTQKSSRNDATKN